MIQIITIDQTPIMVIEMLFWMTLGTILLTYFGYPLLLYIACRMFSRDTVLSADLPQVTIVISAYNEEQNIRAILENKLALDYPKDKLKIIVVSDGSTDGTDSIVRSFENLGIRLIVQCPRQGKTAALNRAVAEAKGEIIVFSDANSIYKSSALRLLVRNFGDPSTGYVTGKMVYTDDKGSLIGDGCSAYMKYENMLRAMETRVSSLVGVDGGIDAVRKSLYKPMRADQLPDFILPLNIVEQGYRVVYEPEAILREDALTDSNDEFRMRVRVILRSLHALWDKRHIFNPLRYGVYSFQLIMHKLLRYLAGIFQLLSLMSNILLINRETVYLWLFGGQIIFYVFAFLGMMLKDKNKVALFAYPYYFCLLNLSGITAILKFMNGEKQITWNPRKGGAN